MTQLNRIVLTLAFLAGSTASAAGYEKNIMFGGKSAGLAGINTPYSTGAASVYFNPAGIVGDQVGHNAAVYLSPSMNANSGPFNDDNETINSESSMVFPLGLFWNNTLSEKWGYGFGVYVAGGSVIKFKDVEYLTASNSTISSDLQIFEASLGAGYRVNEKLKVGLAWRATMGKASFAFANRAGGGNLVNAEVNGINATDFMGARLGMQYKLSDKTMLGASYRSEVNIGGKGKFGGKFRAAGGTDFDIIENDVEASTTFPQQLTVGIAHSLNDKWNIFGEYGWTQYAKVHHITLDGELEAETVGVLDAEADDLEQDFDDQHNIKVAAEYLGWSLPFRFGAQFVSQVTPGNIARVTSTPPGPGWGLTAGTAFKSGEKMTWQAAFEYGTLTGEGSGSAAGTTTGDIRAGEYSAQSYALHLGWEYGF